MGAHSIQCVGEMRGLDRPPGPLQSGASAPRV